MRTTTMATTTTTMMTTKRALPLAWLFGLSLLVAACSGGDDPGTSMLVTVEQDDWSATKTVVLDFGTHKRTAKVPANRPAGNSVKIGLPNLPKEPTSGDVLVSAYNGDNCVIAEGRVAYVIEMGKTVQVSVTLQRRNPPLCTMEKMDAAVDGPRPSGDGGSDAPVTPDDDGGARDGGADRPIRDAFTGDLGATGRTNGLPCTMGTECSSGSCVDGVCCSEATCTGCKACNVGGKEGQCVAVPAGEDPKNACEKEANPCGRDGFCDGTGACQIAKAGTQCEAAACSGTSFTPARTCNGTGVCSPAAPQSCGNWTCTAAGCRTTCAGNSDCAPGKTCTQGSCGLLPPGAACQAGGQCATGNCVDGVCCGAASCGSCQKCAAGGTCVSVASADDDSCNGTRTCDAAGVCKKKQGQACSAATECLSGNCASGVCCESACGGCRTCNQSGKEGQCLAVAAGMDPNNACNPDGSNPCGHDGACDGSGSCRYRASSTSCGSASCSGGSFTPAGTCSGSGTCRPGTAQNCGDQICTSSGCSACTSSTQCGSGKVCVGGKCTQPRKGERCETGVTCAGGLPCVDGYCCESACDGTCKTCSATPGTCTTVTQARDPDTCSGSFFCDYNAQCIGLLDNGTSCTDNSHCKSGSCRSLFRDDDGDGYGYNNDKRRVCANPGGAFPAGYTDKGDDCCDTDNRAHPNAQDAHTTPMSCGQPFTTSFDFDCDGQEVTGNAPGFHGVDAVFVECVDDVETPGPWRGGVPACGQEGVYVECTHLGQVFGEQALQRACK